jgi:hypothetical protein
MNYLISYNRSGNTWVRYVLECLTHQPTWGHQKFSISERFKSDPPFSVSGEPIIIKRHEIIPDEIKDTDKVVFLLRNPTECIWTSMNCKNEFFEPEYQKYLALFRFYMNFKGEKQLFFYDMIYSEYVIEILMRFLGFSDKIGVFMDNIEKHKGNCFSIYDNSINTRYPLTVKPLTDEELKFISRVVERNEFAEIFRQFI